ncbi:MAG: hypothetical protein [Bacteriophage sp.]|nr:MAG: hypothetical protein [Bacteriophage sp.]
MFYLCFSVLLFSVLFSFFSLLVFCAVLSCVSGAWFFCFFVVLACRVLIVLLFGFCPRDMGGVVFEGAMLDGLIVQ